MSLFNYFFPSYSDNPEQAEISLESLQKRLAIIHYYGQKAEINTNLCYADTNQYLTTEDIEFLIRDQLSSYALRDNNNFDLTNVHFLEDKSEFPLLQAKLETIGPLAENENIKLLLKIKKGEPSHYNTAIGVHVVPVYIRHCGNALNIFIYDAANGLNVDVKDGFHHMLPTLKLYAEIHYPNLPVSIIKTSTITMAEMFSCPIQGLHALSYFIERGDTIFNQFKESDFVKEKDKICDQGDPNIKHLKVGRLPPYLLQQASRLTVKEVQEAYAHPWMQGARPILLTDAYYDSQDVLKHARQAKVGNKGETVKQIMHRYGFQKLVTGNTPVSGLTLEKMARARVSVGKDLLRKRKGSPSCSPNS